MARPLIDGEELGYGATVVLRDVTFALAPGERVAVLGRSGAGKSTLLTSVYRRLTAAGRRVALVPQDHALVPQLSVFHNVFMGRLDERSSLYNLANLAWPFPSERARVEPVLEEVGLSGLSRREVGALSGGQKQRTALARAIHRGGDILIGDEPVSAVDEHQAAAIVAGLKDRFPTMLLSLHDVELARGIATRILGIKRGRIVFDRPAGELEQADFDDLYTA
ncbi:ATP-binding cassette domain-containing protein [Aureimonas populi]|uniref:ATP-binding cassette domain-containing protein n=1 Tax=Aureimonas populi TaxID=1701758 RepID=A0ABW5CLC2_9HYPH|nr:ATP-binding cassette domain-containing protein [Aureimonas populi]